MFYCNGFSFIFLNTREMTRNNYITMRDTYTVTKKSKIGTTYKRCSFIVSEK